MPRVVRPGDTGPVLMSALATRATEGKGPRWVGPCRTHRGLPPDRDFGPPEPAIVNAIDRGAGGVNSVALCARRPDGSEGCDGTEGMPAIRWLTHRRVPPVMAEPVIRPRRRERMKEATT